MKDLGLKLSEVAETSGREFEKLHELKTSGIISEHMSHYLSHLLSMRRHCSFAKVFAEDGRKGRVEEELLAAQDRIMDITIHDYYGEPSNEWVLLAREQYSEIYIECERLLGQPLFGANKYHAEAVV